MEVLVSQLAAAGITLETRGLDLATWLERVNTNGEYEFTHLTSGATLDTYISGAGRQPLGTDASQVTDEEFDSLIEASDSIIDRDEYLEVMSDAAKRFADIAWVIPLFSPDVPTLARDDIEGLPTHRTLIEFDYAALSWAD